MELTHCITAGGGSESGGQNLSMHRAEMSRERVSEDLGESRERRAHKPSEGSYYCAHYVHSGESRDVFTFGGVAVQLDQI